jgi:hypothetical protein
MRRITSLALTLFVAACGGGGSDNPPDSGPPPTPDAGENPPDAGEEGDGNDSFGEAANLPLNTESGAFAVIERPSDYDYFVFTVPANTWLVLDISANEMDELGKLDSVIRLYDSSMTLLAENDDGVPRVNTDSEIITRVTEGGTYYVEVFEYGEWIPGDTVPPTGNSTYAYTLTGFTIDPAALTGVVEDPETGDDAGSASPAELASGQVNLILGDFNDGTDVDVFSFSLAAGGTANTVFSNIMPDGTTGYGSTTNAGRMWITDATGATIIARIDNGTGQNDLSPPLTAGTDYLLWIEFPQGGATGANDFYVIKAFLSGDNPAEGAAANDTAATAEALTLMPNGTIRSAFVLATLPGGTDVDYFSFTTNAGEAITIACGAASSGSGLVGLRAEIRDSTDTLVLGADEDPLDGIVVSTPGAVAAGTYYMRLSATGQDAEVTSDFARCGAHAITP